MDNKAQLTTFVVLGIVILVIIGLFFAAKNAVTEKTAEEEAREIIGTPLQPVRVFVDECVKQAAEDALVLVGMHGGYISFPEGIKTVVLDENPIAYWYYEGDDIRPYQTAIEEQIDSYIDEKLNICIKGFADFAGVTSGSAKTKTSIADKSVVVNVDYPVELKQEENSYKMSKFRVELPVRLGMMIEDINSVVDMELILNNEIDLTYLSELIMNFDIYRPAEDILIYGAYDVESLVNGRPYGFVFANKFILTAPEENNPPQITNAQDLTAAVGQALTYDFEAADKDKDALIFSALGIINATIDENTLDIKVTDGIDSDVQTIVITVS